jgi:hypothetical protein
MSGFTKHAANPDDLEEFDLTKFKDFIDRNAAGTLTHRWNILTALIWQAIDNPGVTQSDWRKDTYDGRTGHMYEFTAIYDPATMIARCYRIPCPNRTYHHLDQICEVCKAKC